MITSLFIFGDLTLFLIRFVLGVILIAHGWMKLKDFKQTTSNFEAIKFRPGILFASLAVAIELGGGILLALGFLSQIVAILVAAQMIIAALWKAVKEKRRLVGGYEFELLVVAVALFIVSIGSGMYSLDYYFNWIIW